MVSSKLSLFSSQRKQLFHTCLHIWSTNEIVFLTLSADEIVVGSKVFMTDPRSSLLSDQERK